MNLEQDAPLEINSSRPAVATVICLHGLGASGEDFLSLAPELELLTGLALRFVFPNAPMVPVTVNNGYVMRAWYDIISFERNSRADQQGIARSLEYLGSLIEKEQTQGMAANKIIIMGFSQGAAMALNLLFSYPEKLAGIIALSGYLTGKGINSEVNRETPVFLGHGVEDAVVPYFLGQECLDTLKKEGYPVTWRSYVMGHTVCQQEIFDFGAWVKGIFAP